MKVVLVVLALLLGVGGTANATPILHTADFIPDESRTAFNGFESLPSGLVFDVIYTFDGIQVDLLPLNGPVWTGCSGATFCTAQEGSRSWYPIGSDNGYTRITLANGEDFSDLGFQAGSGFVTAGAVYLNYQALLDGGVVLFGSVLIEPDGKNYLGFGGGGFDEIRINATPGVPYLPAPNVFSGLQLDSIETGAPGAAVPEPAAMLLIATGGVGLVLRARRPRVGL